MNTFHIQDTTAARKHYLRNGDWWRILLLWLTALILRYGLFCLMIVASADTSLSQEQTITPVAFYAGEVLRYKVKWSFIRLGSLVVQQEQADCADKTRYRITLTAESALGLPFIDVFFVNQGIVSTETLASFKFTSDVGRDRKNKFVHQIDTSAKTLILSEFVYEHLTRSDTLTFNELIYDDPGLFMLFRCLAASGETREVSSVMESRIETTTFRFPTELEHVEVAALDNPVRAFRFEGKANWTRPEYAGLKGEFCGWVSTDSAAIPLRIEAKIFLGSIVLELESFERNGWKPTDSLFTQLRK